MGTPEEYMGDVIGDINSRRGMVAELSERGNMKIVRANVPLANMFQYVSSLRSATKGRASYAMNLDRYDLVPPTLRRRSCPSTRATRATTTSRLPAVHSLYSVGGSAGGGTVGWDIGL